MRTFILSISMVTLLNVSCNILKYEEIINKQPEINSWQEISVSVNDSVTIDIDAKDKFQE